MLCRDLTKWLSCLGCLLAASTSQAADESKRASWTDHLEDVAEPHVNLFVGSLYAEDPSADVEISINLSDVLPQDRVFELRYQVGFDADNNRQTGEPFGLCKGMDQILTIQFSGQAPFTGPNDRSTALLTDVGSGKQTELARPEVETSYLIVETFEPPGRPPIPTYSVIRLMMPLPLLGQLADQVPVAIQAVDSETGMADEAVFMFRVNMAIDPYLGVKPEQCAPGESVAVVGKRFDPSRLVRITLDEQPLAELKSAADGSFTVSTRCPAVPAGDHLLAAIDETGREDLRVLRVMSGQKQE